MLPNRSPDGPTLLAGAHTARRPGRGFPLICLFVGLTAIACSGDKAGDSGAAGDADYDADGFPEATDCNDRDNTIYPGADDAWYDGVDQDCAGDDDFDADTDGHRSLEFGGLDCDDANPDISPDATEIWYDGVDQDCAGDDDFDADRDGFSTDTDGGDFDCDDTRSDVKPGAIEIWYDGTDGDCAGDDDFDADGDSFPSALYADGGTDCDDDDDDIHPDAVEIWYDGIDGDCDGADDFDADGDGEAAAGEVATGSDCNDTDPTIYTGAQERLDGLDSDCDDEDDVFTSDQDVLGSQVFGEGTGANLGTVLAAGRVNSDDFIDLAVVQSADDGLTSGGFGVIYFIDGQSLAEGPVVAAEGNSEVEGGSLTQLATGSVEAVVLFDDYLSGGYRALVGTPDHTVSTERVGAAWMVQSNISTFATLTNTITSKWRFIGEVDGGDFGATLLGDADFDTDGDGTRDVVIAAPSDDGGRVYIFQSDTLNGTDGEFVASDADIIFTGASATGALGTSLAAGDFAAGDDADDDGDAWLVVGDPLVNSGQGAVYVVKNDFASMTSGPIATQASTTIPGTAGSNLGQAVATGEALDGGDVQEELIVGAPRAITRAGQLQFYDGSAVHDGGTLSCTESGTGRDCYLRYTGSAIDGFAGTTLISGLDVTGSGLDDVLVGGPGNVPNGSGSGASWLVADAIPSTGQSLINASATFNGASAGDGLGYGLTMGDFNADGKADVAYGAPGHDVLSNEGQVRVYLSHYPDSAE